MPATRRLAAILAADVAGYSRLMGLDEAGTAQALREHHAVAEPLVTRRGGRIVKTTGDGALIEFASVVGAVECALALQQLAAERNRGIADERRMEWRIGVYLGDVLVEGDDILGDGVNVAARLEGIAEPGGICISEDAFRQVRGKVDAGFTDIGEQQLKNIVRPLRVYRVRAESPLATPSPPAGEGRVGVLPLPDRPSIAVMPFANMSGDPEQEYFADGMVEEIITALSRICWLFVIARNSTFTYKGQSVDVKQAAETARAAHRPTNDLTAYDLYLRAYALDLTSAPEALRLLDQAIERDPHYGPALALAANFHAQRCIAGWSQDPKADCRKGADLARRALRAGGDDPSTIVNAAGPLAFFDDDIGAMMGLVDRALALNPSFARGWNNSGLLSLFAGQPERAIEHAETALRLSPRARVGTTVGIIGTAHLVSRRFGEALPKLLLAIQEAPTFPVPYRWLASCYAHMGRLDEARDVVKRLRALTPVVVPSATQFRNPEHRELLLSGLRLAATERT